ncbi:MULTISPECIES: TonB-dependent receptor [unclassified Sphingobium]|uniref:TonB-dependent receptor n=1 Tax=unclassified Sphingobium TaxID=2611147 RepID=UPI0035A5D1FE
MRKLTLKSCLLIGTATLVVSPALAQDQASTGAPAATIDEIVVTAQNRAESVQDVPIAINVISGEALQDAGVTDLRELDRVASGVQITQDQQNTYVAVRGIGTASNNETQDTSVTINIDGEYINRTTVLNAAVFDLERVEVLRGPQGTLYGRNATAGAVNFITRKPGDAFAANGSVSYGNYDQVIANAGVDLPISEGFAIRASGIYSKRGKGYTFHPNMAGLRAANPLAGKPYKPNYADRSGTQDMKAGRLSLRLEPTDNLRIDAAVEYADSYALLENYTFVDLNGAAYAPTAGCGSKGYVEVAPLQPGTQCIPLNTGFLANVDRSSYNGPTTGVGFQSMESFALRGRIAYDIGKATLTYIGGYRKTDSIERPTLPPAYVFIDFGSTVETQNHELRLNGEAGGILYQFGAFYYNEELNQARGLHNPFIGPNGSYITYFRRTPVQSKSWSVFGQVDVPLTPELTAQGGLRYTKGDRDAVFQNYNFVFNAGPNELTTPAPQTLNLAQSEDNISWLAGLNYKPNANTLIYGKVSTGFKGGGFDAVGTYGPEKNTAYEAGLKLDFGERNQHKFNLSGFYYDYAGLQNAVLLDNTKGGQIFNAGGATIWGIEAEWDFQLDKWNSFYGSFNYLNAEFDDLAAAYAVICVPNSGCTAANNASVGDLDPNTPGVQQPNLAGNTPPMSPEVVISLGYDHIFDLGSAGTVTASAFSRFKSKYFMTVFNERDLTQKAFTQTDLSLTYRPENRKFSIAGYVQNVENVRPMVFGAFVAAGPDRVLNAGFSRPRTYGVRVGFDF